MKLISRDRYLAATSPEPAAREGAAAGGVAPLVADSLMLWLCVGAAYLGGVGLLARAFSAPGASALAYGLFWGGLGLCYLSAAGLAWARRESAGAHIGALMLLGAALWLPSLLRSPGHSLFADELHHMQLLRMMAERATTRLPVTIFPIPGDYPGLEFVGLSALAATGLSVEATARLVSLAVHVSIPALAYLTLARLGLRPLAAFLAALVYCSNTSYYFFHSVFSYESLGILFYLLTALAALRRVEPGEPAALGDAVLLLMSIGAAVVTHHVSSLMGAGLLITLAIAQRIASGGRGASLTNAAQLAVVLWLSWLIYQTLRAINYLYHTIADRLLAILAYLLEEQRQQRQLFWNATLPPAEQIIAYSYPVLLALLIGAGGLIALARLRAARRGGLPLPVGVVSLGIFGAGAWAATAPLILTKSSELIYRAWPFLFLGVALYAGLAIEWLLRRRGGSAALALPALLLAGAVIVGDHQAGRFRQEQLRTAAGPEAITDDLIAAATWLEREAGQLNTVVGSKSSIVAFADFAGQRTSLYGAWVPYYTRSPHVAQAYLDEQRVAFLVVDWRDSRLLPRYGHYFSQAELFQVADDAALLNKRLPADRLAKFDTMPRLQRIYDGGDIVLFRNRILSAPEAHTP